MFKYTLDTTNARAFRREKGWADWESSASRVYAGAGETKLDLPADFTTALDVQDRRSALIQIHSDNASAELDIEIYAGMNSPNTSGWYLMDGGRYMNLTGGQLLGVNCQVADYIYIVITNNPSYAVITIDIAPIQYEDEAGEG